MERDYLGDVEMAAKGDFNSHAHVERDLQGVVSSGKTLNFNSHAHVERDISKELAEKSSKISTHTLTWSVTMNLISIFHET